MASTTRVLPDPVGPRNSRFPTGRWGGLNPARNVWYTSAIFSIAVSWPTIFRRRAQSNACASWLRRLGSSIVCSPVLIMLGSPEQNSEVAPRGTEAISRTDSLTTQTERAAHRASIDLHGANELSHTGRQSVLHCP